VSVSSYLLLGFHHDSGGSGATAAEIWDYQIQGSYTALDVLRILAAVAAGKTNIAALGNSQAEVEFRAIDDSQVVVAADMDGSERTDVTLTP
jgi:hypothetical protein